MKKTLLLIAGTCISYASFAQLTQGSIMANGSVGYTSTGTSTTTNLTALSTAYDSATVPKANSTTVSVSLSGGYFVADCLVAGLSIGYSANTTPLTEWNNSNNTYDTYTDKTTGLSIGLFATKYIRLADKFYFTGTANISIGSSELNNAIFNYNDPISPWTEYSETIKSFTVSMAPGLAYFPTDHWGIILRLNNILNFTSSTTDNIPDIQYSSSNQTEISATQTRTTNIFGIGAGLSPTIGVTYVFGKGTSAATN